MIDLSKSCIKCAHKQWNEGHKMICGKTLQLVNFENSCDYYETDKDQQLKETNEEILNQQSHATSKTRVINYALDQLFIFIIMMIFGVGIIIFFGINSEIYNFIFVNNIASIIITLIITIFYYVIFEFAFGKSPAKFITHTKVLTVNGKKPDFTAIIIRTLCRFIPFEPFTFLESNTSGWHDTLSNTIVITEAKKNTPKL
jgi:uncharacterized RDD family membrane protein YckC